MKKNLDETQEILERARAGDSSAFEELFKRHRAKLKRAIAFRLDPRVAARVDASDILQEAHLEAFRRLPEYLEQGEMPLYGWLHWIAHEKVLEMHRRHLGAKKRTVRHEVPLTPVDSSAKFVSGLVGRLPTPSQELAKVELAEQLRLALRQLNTAERDLILWKNFEQLSDREIAELLGIKEGAANKRYLRAVERLIKILKNLGIPKSTR